MKNRNIGRLTVALILYVIYSTSVSAASFSVNNQTYTLNAFIDESINKYSEIRLASLNINRLAYEMGKVESQLGWILTGQGGYFRDVSGFGIQSDTADFSVGLQKLLESGNTLSLSGRYSHVKSDQVLFSLLPNPANTTKLEINYRIPLLEGENNPQYLFAVKKAEIEKKISELDKQQIKEKLIQKLIDIFYAVVTIDSRLITAQRSLKRVQQLRVYIKNNINLGLLEKGDILQADSQILTLKLEQQKIIDLRKKQVVLINRFLDRGLSSEFIVNTENLYKNKTRLDNTKKIISIVKENNCELKKLKARNKLLDSSLALSRNREKDKLDVVLSLGVQNISGSSSTRSMNDTYTTGMIRLEYKDAIDKRGFSSKRLQIQIDKHSNNERIDSLAKDLKYETFNLLSQIEQSKKIVKITESRYLNETRKYHDILKRFHNGRSTTNTVIQFDNDRIRAELDSETEKYELAKRFSLLKLKQGLFLN